MEKIEWVLFKVGKFLFHSFIYVVSIYDQCRAPKYAGNNEYVPLDNKFTSVFSPIDHKCGNLNLKHSKFTFSPQKPTKLDTKDFNEKSLNNSSKAAYLAGGDVTWEGMILSGSCNESSDS